MFQLVQPERILYMQAKNSVDLMEWYFTLLPGCAPSDPFVLICTPFTHTHTHACTPTYACMHDTHTHTHMHTTLRHTSIWTRPTALVQLGKQGGVCVITWGWTQQMLTSWWEHSRKALGGVADTLQQTMWVINEPDIVGYEEASWNKQLTEAGKYSQICFWLETETRTPLAAASGQLVM